MVYESIEPFGERPAYLRAGIIAATIANVFRSKKSKRFSPDDFMPQEPKPAAPQVQSVTEQKRALERIFEWAKRQGLTKKKKGEK